MSEVKTTHSCAVCDKSASKICAGCSMVRYCSVECQKEHWSSKHKTECVDIVDVLLDRDKRKTIGKWMCKNGFTFKRLHKMFLKGKRVMPSYLEPWKNSFMSTCGQSVVWPYGVLTGLSFKNPNEPAGNFWAPIWELPCLEAVTQVKTILERVWELRAKKIQNRESFQLKVLELGCGIGLWSYLLQRTCGTVKFEFIATDISDDKSVIYHRDGNQEFDQVDVEIIDYKKAVQKYGSFDPVVFWSWVPLGMNPTPDIVAADVSTIIYSREECTGTNSMCTHPGYKTECFFAASICQTDSFYGDSLDVRHMSQVVLSKELDLNEKCWKPWTPIEDDDKISVQS